MLRSSKNFKEDQDFWPYLEICFAFLLERTDLIHVFKAEPLSLQNRQEVRARHQSMIGLPTVDFMTTKIWNWYANCVLTREEKLLKVLSEEEDFKKLKKRIVQAFKLLHEHGSAFLKLPQAGEIRLQIKPICKKGKKNGKQILYLTFLNDERQLHQKNTEDYARYMNKEPFVNRAIVKLPQLRNGLLDIRLLNRVLVYLVSASKSWTADGLSKERLFELVGKAWLNPGFVEITLINNIEVSLTTIPGYLSFKKTLKINEQGRAIFFDDSEISSPDFYLFFSHGENFDLEKELENPNTSSILKLAEAVDKMVAFGTE